MGALMQTAFVVGEKYENRKSATPKETSYFNRQSEADDPSEWEEVGKTMSDPVWYRTICKRN
jgi:hypothetical protein